MQLFSVENILVRSAATLLLLLQVPLTVRSASVCNGYSELCDRSVGNITWVGTHDSYAVGVNNIAANQDYNITQQLTDGVRMLQSQAHNNSGTIELCHTSCGLLDGGSLENYLKEVKAWMDSNPNEVVVLLIVNIDDLPPTNFVQAFEGANVTSISYEPSQSNMTFDSWPTLGDLIDNGTRLITFLDFEANISEVPYLLDEFSNIWETAYDLTNQSAFDCAVNRSNGDTSSQMFLINHFLDQLFLGQDLPDPNQAAETNAVNGTGSLGAQVETCLVAMDRPPTFMLVDFYEYGNGSVFEVAAAANGVTYTPKAIATPQTSDSSSSSSSSSSDAVSALEISSSIWLPSLLVLSGMLSGALSLF